MEECEERMAGYILLAGGAEFGGLMSQCDLRALALAGGREARVSIIPTAAAPSQRHQYVGTNGIHWFRSLGARYVDSLPIINRVTANDPVTAKQIRQSRLIYFVDGFMGYLHRSLENTLCWQAVLDAYEDGAVIAGSGAGAMVLGQYFYDPAVRHISNGLGLLSNVCILPHHNQFGWGWVERLKQALPGIVVLGIDERTGVLDDIEGAKRSEWNVYGQGTVTRYQIGVPVVYSAGQRFIDSFIEQV